MPRRDKTVLYVEDESADVFLLTHAFARIGLENALHSVQDGSAAQQYLSGDGRYANRSSFPIPAVVLLDLNLPGIHGFEVLKWIRAQPDLKRLPVIVFSSSAREDDKSIAVLLGATDYWQKPNSGDQLRDVVQKLVTKWLETGSL